MKNRFITFIKYFIGASLLGAVLIVGSIFIIYYNIPEIRIPRIIKEGNTKKIDKLIAKNGINAYYGDDTLLIYAIEANDKKTVEYLIKKGADINLISQVYGGHYLREHSVLLNLTPLLIAIEKGNKEIAELLIQNGADVNAKNAWGETPLSTAVSKKDIEMVKMLINAGADVNEGKSLVKAKDDLYHQISLANMGIDTARDRNDYIEIINLLESSGAKDNLFSAIYRQDLESVKKLIKEGEDLNIKNAQDELPLEFAKEHSTTEIVNLLIANGAKENKKEKLSSMIRRKDLERIKKFIQEETDLTENGTYTNIMLDAVKTHDINIVKTFIEAGVNINTEYEILGEFPLRYASEAGDIEIVQMLINAGADVNFKNKKNQTALMIFQRNSAFVQKYLKIIKILIESGADVNAQDNNGNTPLFYASTQHVFEDTPTPKEVEKGWLEIIKTLIDAGANVNAKNFQGETLLKAASNKYYHNKIIPEFLIANGAKE